MPHFPMSRPLALGLHLSLARKSDSDLTCHHLGDSEKSSTRGILLSLTSVFYSWKKSEREVECGFAIASQVRVSELKCVTLSPLPSHCLLISSFNPVCLSVCIHSVSTSDYPRSCVPFFTLWKYSNEKIPILDNRLKGL